MRGQVFNQALVRLHESGFREVRRWEGLGEGRKGIGEGTKRVEYTCGQMRRFRERYCDLTKRKQNQKGQRDSAWSGEWMSKCTTS